jgi:hypothetical protein
MDAAKLKNLVAFTTKCHKIMRLNIRTIRISYSLRPSKHKKE